MVFLHFQGVQKLNIGLKWINIYVDGLIKIFSSVHDFCLLYDTFNEGKYIQ